MDENINACLIRILKSNSCDIDFIIKRIVLNSSAVLLGCKPSCTMTFNYQGSIYNPYLLWDKYKDMVFKYARLKYYELYRSDRYVTVLIFDEKKLNILLKKNDPAKFLNSMGYDKNMSLKRKLSILKSRFIFTIPHEIGVFLGIPIKDVRGFMKKTPLPYTCNIGWKVYGRTEPSINLYNSYKNCKYKILYMLADNIDPFEILRNYP